MKVKTEIVAIEEMIICAVCNKPVDAIEKTRDMVRTKWTVYCHGKKESTEIETIDMVKKIKSIKCATAFESEAKQISYEGFK